MAEGGAVTGEGYFGTGDKAQNADVEIQDASGKVIAQGKTVTDGTFRIPLPQGAAPPLKVVLKAGEGHQNDFTLTAQDMGLASEASAGASVPASSQSAQSVQTAPLQAAAALDAARIQSLVEAAAAKAVEEKLTPLKLELAKLTGQEQATRLRDIVGGIGWIVGLVGLAAWFKRPRR